MKIRGKVLMAFSVGLVLLILQAGITSHFISQLKDAVVTLDLAVHASKSAAATVDSIKSMQGEISVYSDVHSFPTLRDTLAVYKSDVDSQLSTLKKTSEMLAVPASSTDPLFAALEATNSEFTALMAEPIRAENEEAIFERLLYVAESLDSLAEESSKLIVDYEQTLDAAIGNVVDPLRTLFF